MKFNIWLFFENTSRKFWFHQNLTRITGTLNEEQYTFLIISRLVLLRMRNVSDKIVEKIETHLMFNKLFSDNHAVYEIMWKNIVVTDRP